MSSDRAGAVPRVRSQLYVPGHRVKWMERALDSGADCLLLDLEDSVLEDGRSAARDLTSGFLRDSAGEKPCLVRVSPADTREFLADVRAVIQAGATGIVLPKVTGRDDVVVADRVLGWLEAEFDRPAGSVLLCPLFETAPAIWAARDIVGASARVAYAGGVTAPGGDVARALGFRWSAGGDETATMRALVLLAVRAAGVLNPVTGTWADVADLDGLRAFARSSRALGYEGFAVIHPSHVEVVNEVFGPDAEELDYQRGLLEALDAAARDGLGAVSYRGRMVDIAMRETARRILAEGGG